MGEVEKIRDRLNRLGEFESIRHLEPKSDEGVAYAVRELTAATAAIILVLVEQEEDRLRDLGIDPDAEGEHANGQR